MGLLENASAALSISRAPLIAVFEEQEPLHKIESPSGNPTDRQSPDAFETEVAAQLAAFKPIGGEIEVTPSALKLGTPLLVRRSSDPAPGPPADSQPSTSHPGGQSLKPVVPDSMQNLEDSEVMNGVQTELQTSPKIKDAL
ncbi:PREDICTED: partitioning defective 3 homolog B-like, partial [Propithecus coquereli]|uniref:partitioning defective 3 homolog B-like n=1 Tax=Propithecus coquereli TaxID=379532 RepID=UPI00063F5D3A